MRCGKREVRGVKSETIPLAPFALLSSPPVDAMLLLESPMHPAALSIDRLLRDCSERHVRRSGPGGQHRNKVESGVILKHAPTGVAAEASERRTQRENLKVVIGRLRRNLALEVREEVSARGPSEAWRSRVRNGRLAVSERHELFPTLLAEALDHLSAADWDVGRAAERLGITSSQLVKFFKLEPRALRRLNDERAARGLGAMK